MAHNYLTLLFAFVLYLACMPLPFDIIAGENSFLKVYQGGYEISRQQDFPIVGSTALVFKLNYDFPPKEVTEFYDNIFDSANAKPFGQLSATRKWRTYH